MAEKIWLKRYPDFFSMGVSKKRLEPVWDVFMGGFAHRTRQSTK